MGKSTSKGGILRAFAVDSTIMAILAIIMGILLIATPVTSGVFICVLSGIFLIGMGVVAMFGFFAYGPILAGYSLVMGIAMAMCGLLCLVQPGLVMGLLTVIFGIFVVVDASTTLADGIHCIRNKVSGGVFITILSAVMLVLGIFVMFGPAETVVLLLGWVLVLDGIFDIVFMLVFGKRIREAREAFSKDNVIDLGEQ